MNNIPENAEVCAVITTYCPDSGFPDRVERIRKQVGSIVIVDDGQSDENVRRLHEWFSTKSSVILYHNPTNIGIAAALNNGVAIAIREGFEWFLTLDDDSLVHFDMVERLLVHLKNINNIGPIGLIGMSFSQLGALEPFDFPRVKLPKYVEKRYIITSGSLFSVATYEGIGPFREEFVIDWVDYDYCLRARAKGFRVMRIDEVGFAHRLGELMVHCFMGISVSVNSHTALRLYYWYRNSTVLAFEHIFRDPLFCCAVLLGQMRMFCQLWLFEPDKIYKVRWILRGILDGWLKRLGKMPQLVNNTGVPE